MKTYIVRGKIEIPDSKFLRAENPKQAVELTLLNNIDFRPTSVSEFDEEGNEGDTFEVMNGFKGFVLRNLASQEE